ncbi:UvrB/UvrC motif-containing protein [uncultured Tyzzerella sp.]|uniref:UvrB/UvrC motif-containing protein n=1 Tax=uncultured Tyzzerella sp. TaxID=2321398 RepID=UPI00294369CC|nr:UvrB/UvrC motif-containing protein [uncultured Tyzzerella sp.]
MLCEKCKKNKASIKYSQNINGLKVDYNLCEDCFNKVNYNNDFISNFFNSFFTNNILLDTQEKNYKCKICGNTFEQFKNSGKMGCANCYDIFREKLNPIFNNIQQKNIHTGKKPKNLETYKPSADSVDILREKLNVCIKNEDYEQAIKIRDRIRAMERGDM